MVLVSYKITKIILVISRKIGLDCHYKQETMVIGRNSTLFFTAIFMQLNLTSQKFIQQEIGLYKAVMDKTRLAFPSHFCVEKNIVMNS